MPAEVDILVVGGGLAGSAVATLLSKSGRDVLLVERSSFPRDKLCGEFLSPESQGILRSMEILDRVEKARPARITRARFVGPSGRTVPITLPAPAYGISRKHLDTELFDAAKAAGSQAWTLSEVSGLVRVEDGHEVEVRRDGKVVRVRARVVVCAHGRRGRPDHALSRSFLTESHPFIGLKRHHRPADDIAGRALADELEDHVEIYPFHGGYCGMSFIETGEVNVCLLAHQDLVRDASSGWDSVVAALSAQSPPLAARLSALVPTDPQPLAVAAVPFSPKSRYEQGVFFVGDAAGMIAPLAGDGQAMALDSGRRLAGLLGDAASADRDELGRRWSREWRKHYGTRMALAARIQRLLLKPGSAEWTIRIIGGVPGLPDLLGRLTRGAQS